MSAMQNSHVNTIKAEKAFEKIQHVFIINTLESIEPEEINSSVINTMCIKSIATIILNRKT